jgi:hypothetical protein
MLTGSPALVAGQVAGRTAPIPDLPVPGGLAAFARAAGLSPDTPRARLLTTAIRVVWDRTAGSDPAGADRRRNAVLAYLRQVAGAERASKAPGSGRAPVPGAETLPGLLPAEAWGAVLPKGDEYDGCLFAAIVASRRGALLYHGLAALDESTRVFLAAHPDLLNEIAAERRVGVFATMGRSLRVESGRLLVPGGADAVPAWEALAVEKTTDVPAFILRLLTKDGGRLAWLYDAVAHLEPGARRFVLSPADSSTHGNRVEHFRAFYDAASAAVENWRPSDRPFEREPYDAVQLLLSTAFSADGRLLGPAWADLWEGVFNGLANADEEIVMGRRSGAGERLDAVELVKRVCVADVVVRRARVQQWLFANRVFRDAERPTFRHLMLALRGVSQYPALTLTLDRMGITTPSTYATAVRTAARLGLADRKLWQFQAALSIVERARASRSIDVPAAEALVLSLCAATPEEGDFGGALARWLEAGFLKSVPASVLPPDFPTADAPVEIRVLAAMVGAVASPAHDTLAALPRVEWEGLRYRFDPAGSALVRTLAVRRRQGGRTLDSVLALARAGAAIANAPSAGEAKIAAGRLPEIAESLRAVRDSTPLLLPGSEPDMGEVVKDVADRVAKLKAAPDAKARARAARPLEEATDWYLSEVLGAVAYAPFVGEADGPALLGGDPSKGHEFRFFKDKTPLSARGAWELPVESRDGLRGWHLSGSLLGVDLTLGYLGLRRLPRETLPPPPRASDAVRLAFTEAAAFCNPFDLVAHDDAGRAIRDAVGRGRARVASLAGGSADAVSIAAQAELDEWRTEALAWSIGHEPDRIPSFFSLGELARLGGLDPGVAALDAWGTSGWSRDGQPRSSYPVRQPWTTWAGRRGVRAVAALVPDLALGLSERLASLGLPAPFTAGVLLYATQDYLDTLRTAHEDDWQEMVAHAQAIAGSSIEDYVAGLTITGPLVPDETETQYDPPARQAAARQH